MSGIDLEFGARVRAHREGSGVSQRSFASALTESGMQVDASAVSRIENGERSVRLHEALAISVVLGCSIVALVSPDDDGNTAKADAILDRAIAELQKLKTHR